MSERADDTVAVPVTGEPLCLELVNTTFVDGGLRGHVVDALTAPAQLATWMNDHREQLSPDLRSILPGAVWDEASLARAVELRAALRECCTAVTAGVAADQSAVAVVNRFVATGAFHLGLTPTEPVSVRRRWITDDVGAIALGEIAADACELMMPDRAARLRACPAPGCILFFEKLHARREWCSASCGNRVRVARHARAKK